MNLITITGYASTPHLDKDNHIVSLTSWKSEQIKKISHIPILFEHDSNKHIGWIQSGQVTALGLLIIAKINTNSEYGAKAISLIKLGIGKFSVGISVSKMKNRGIRYITSAKLYEVSIVKNAANPYCCIAFKKEQKI